MTESEPQQVPSGPSAPPEEKNNINIFNYNDVMNTLMNHPLTGALNKLYEKTTYLDRYGGSLVFAISTIIGVCMFFTYSYLKNHSDVIKNNWQQNRCNPLYIPFAGIIINPKNMTKSEYATNNFFHCFGVLLKEIVEAALAPIEAASLLISASVSLIIQTMNSLMSAILYLRNAFENGFGLLGNRSLNSLTLLARLTQLVKNSFMQGEGVLVTIMFIFFTAYDMLNAFFNVVIVAVLVILAIALAAMIAAWLVYLAVSVFPIIGWILGSIFGPIAVGLTLVYVCILIMVIVVIIFTVTVMNKTAT